MGCYGWLSCVGCFPNSFSLSLSPPPHSFPFSPEKFVPSLPDLPCGPLTTISPHQYFQLQQHKPKAWARGRGLNEARLGSLSSYGYSLLCIGYMQAVGALPSLPCVRLAFGVWCFVFVLVSARDLTLGQLGEKRCAVCHPTPIPLLLPTNTFHPSFFLPTQTNSHPSNPPLYCIVCISGLLPTLQDPALLAGAPRETYRGLDVTYCQVFMSIRLSVCLSVSLVGCVTAGRRTTKSTNTPNHQPPHHHHPNKTTTQTQDTALAQAHVPRPDPSLSLAHLLLGFFDYYGRLFNPTASVVSVRLAKLLDKKVKRVEYSFFLMSVCIYVCASCVYHRWSSRSAHAIRPH